MSGRLSPAVMLDLIEKERERRAASASLYEFVRQSWHVMEPGVEFVPSWHIETICEHLEAVSAGQIKRLLINIPPRHSKSTIVSVAWPMWEWLTDPQQKFLCASYSSVLSIRDNLKARRLIQSPWYQERWGHMFKLAGDQNAKQRFENDKTGYRIATSVGGTATGEGGSRLILDDPHSAQDAQSDAMRDSALEWFDVVWATRLNDPKRDAMVTIMQRLHEADVSGHILNDIGGWEHLMIPAEWDGERRTTVLGTYDPRTEPGQLICPDRFGPKEIADLKRSLGEYGVAGQLQQRPAPAGGGIIKTQHFELWPRGRGLPAFDYVLQSYDTAYSEKTTGDPSACTVWGVFTEDGGRRVALLLDAWNEHLSYPELRERVIRDWGERYAAEPGTTRRGRRPDNVLMEEKASGISLLQDLRLAGVPAVAYNPGRADKVARVHQATPLLESGAFYLLESSREPGRPVSWAREFVAQCEKFPNAAHDDLTDTWSQAAIWLRDNGWLDLQVYEDDEPEHYEPVKRRVNPYGA